MHPLRPPDIGKTSNKQGNNIKCSINTDRDYDSMWEYKYTFEGSTEIRTFVDERSWMTSEAFCERILEDIFNGSAPCGLSTVNSKANISNIDTLNHPIVVRRNYAQKFKQQVPVVKKVVPPKTRKRRWKSPVRRWRSKSPKVRKISIN